jgi:hypothetical protein
VGRAGVVLAAGLLAGGIGLLAARPTGNRYFGDEWFTLGINLRVNRTLGIGAEPTVFRPPLYPAFVAGMVALLPAPPGLRDTWLTFPWSSDLAGLPQVTEPAWMEAAARRVYAGQVVLTAATAVLLSLLVGLLAGEPLGLLAGLVYGTSGYALILSGTLFYGTLHLFFLVLVSLLLALALRHETAGRWLLAGFALGVASLARPVTLLVPVLLAPVLAVRYPLGPAVRNLLATAAGFLLVLLPWSARNTSVAGRFIPVNAQGWLLLYASTVAVHPSNPAGYNWGPVQPALEEVYFEATGERQPGYAPLVRHIVELDDVCRRAALANLRADPGPYLRNALGTLGTLSLDMDWIRLSIFELVQVPSGKPRDWGKVLSPTPLTRAFVLYVWVLTALSAVGFWRGFLRRDWAIVGPMVVFLSVALSHALTWMDPNYYYAKWPFLFVFAFAGIAPSDKWRGVLPWLVAAPSVLLTLALLLG